MIFAPLYSPRERSVVGRLQLLGLDGERCITPRHEFRAELRARLTEAARESGHPSGADGLALAC